MDSVHPKQFPNYLIEGPGRERPLKFQVMGFWRPSSRLSADERIRLGDVILWDRSRGTITFSFSEQHHFQPTWPSVNHRG